MQATWFDNLQSQTSADEEPPGVWAAIKDRLNLVEKRPLANANVVSRELKDRNESYFILKNQETKTYLRLSREQFDIWQQMNGANTVQDLIVDHYMSTGNFAHTMVNRLLEDLSAQHMLTEKPVWAWRELRENLNKRSLSYRLSAPARFLLTQKLAINNIDGFISALYRSVGWIFFTRPMQVLYVLLSIAGLFAFSEIIRNPSYRFFGENYARGIALIWVAMIFPVVIHELGHALTVKHYGREVPKGGVMLYFGMPAAFIDTTDIWMEPRRARLAVTWNGPYTGLILGGSLSLIMFFFPDFSLNSFLFKMVGFAYLTVIFNVNPLLKYDGYYILSDALDISALRERSLAFLRKNLLNRVLERKRLKRDEWIFAVYGVLSILWTVYAIRLVAILWNERVRGGMQVVFGSGYSTVERVFSLIMAAGVFSLGALLFLAVFRLLSKVIQTHNQSGGLAKHGRLALILGLSACGVGIGAARLLQDRTMLLGLLISAGGTAIIWQFAEPYLGAYRGSALRLLAGGLAAAGAAEAFQYFALTEPLIPYLRWTSIALLALAGVLLVWHPARAMRPLMLLPGFAAGIAAFYILRFSGFSLGIQIAGEVIVVLGLWNTMSLRGGARSPAVLLFSLGSLIYVISWEFRPSWGFAPPDAVTLTALSLMAAGALHWAYAQLPQLSEDQSNVAAFRTKDAVGSAVATIVRRVIAQVFFEAGWHGVRQFGREFSAVMKDKGLKLEINGNRFHDDEFAGRTVIELTELYQVAFDSLHGLLRRDLGAEMGNLTFNYGVDRLPWQNREAIFELILSRSRWSSGISEQHQAGKQRLIGFLKRVPLFVTLDDVDLETIAQTLDTEHFAAGDVLMREGDPGDKFYIIERGQVTFWQMNEFGESVRVSAKGAGQFFGEVALVSLAPRNATVRAETPLAVLTLTKSKFDELVRDLVPRNDRDLDIVRRSWLLRSMPIFDELESHELDWLAANMSRETIEKGKVLFREGDPGDRFYIVESGELIISTKKDDDSLEISRCKSGEYLGEIALLQNTPRTATITAAEDSMLLSLNGEDFLDLVSGYSSLGKSVSQTSTRRLSYLEKL